MVAATIDVYTTQQGNRATIDTRPATRRGRHPFCLENAKTENASALGKVINTMGKKCSTSSSGVRSDFTSIMDQFDTERFIMEIEVRRGIWDVSSDDYLNKDTKRQLWMEMASIFGGESLTGTEKEQLSIALKKKWKNIRDCFQRELRRLKGVQSGSTLKRKSTYTYFNLLRFLLSGIDGIPTESAPQNAPLTPENTDDDVETQTLSQVEGTPVLETKLDPVTECDEVPVSVLLSEDLHNGDRRDDVNDSDCDRLFLLSMVDGFRNIPPASKMRARIEVIKIVEKYQPHRLRSGKCNNRYYPYRCLGYSKQPQNSSMEPKSEYSDESQ